MGSHGGTIGHALRRYRGIVDECCSAQILLTKVVVMAPPVVGGLLAQILLAKAAVVAAPVAGGLLVMGRKSFRLGIK